MATTNPVLTTTWAAVCEGAGDFLLTLPTPGAAIEVATTDDGAAPTVTFGHRRVYDLNDSSKNSISRTDIGPGSVFAKAVSPAQITVALNNWNSSLLLFDAGLWATSATWLTARIWR